MIRKNLKLLLIVLIMLMITFSIFSPVVLATNTVTNAETPVTSNVVENNDEATTDENSQEKEIHNGDLYLFESKVIMDKLVDGNVFIFGQDVEITGQINGSLFVIADKLTFDNCYVRYSVFAYADSVYYNGACNDLYVASKDIEMTYDSYVVRDLKALSSILKFKAAVGRDADLYFNSIELGEGEDIPIIYGNLRYKSPSEIEFPEGVITENGSISYTDAKSNNVSTPSVFELINNFLSCIITVITIYLIIRLFMPKQAEKLNNQKLSISKLLKCFLIGILSFVITATLSIILLFSIIGAKLTVIFVLLFVLICLIATPVFAIIITNTLKPLLKLDKKPVFYLVLVLVSIVLYGVTLLPYVGNLFSFLLTTTSIGMLINLGIPHKELTDEEKAIIEEKKKQAKEEKEKRKQEKLDNKKLKKKEKDDNTTL